MKKAIVGIIAILVIIGLVAVGFFGVGSSDYWETETAFGGWQEKIIIEYADGTTKSLKVLQDNPALAIMYQGEEVVNMKYSLLVTADGTGYDSWEYGDWDFCAFFCRSDGSLVSSPAPQRLSGRDNRMFDQYYEMCYIGYSLAVGFAGASPGNYYVKFTPSGFFTYRGIPDGEWQSTDLPAGMQVGVVITEDGTLNVSFKEGVGT